MTTITLSLVSHTNAGKTTLARTLLRRDVGEVLDQAHVTESSEAHMLVQAGDDTLQLWDTPGFGDTARLLKRLRREGDPVGWFLHEVWDRVTDRPLWCGQEAVRNVKQDADVVLYLVNAAEDPADAGYVPLELELLAWLGKPVVLLLNQTGDLDREQTVAATQRWEQAAAGHDIVRDVLVLDAFTRCWVVEGDLLRRLVKVLPEDRQPVMTLLAQAWELTSLERLERCVALMAAHVARAAGDVEVLPEGGGRVARAAAIKTLADRQAHAARDLTEALLVEHGLDGAVAAQVQKHLEDDFELPTVKLEAGSAALWGSLVSGAVGGLAADAMAGGLTLGGGMLAGALMGAMGGAGLAKAWAVVGGDGEAKVGWSQPWLQGLTRETLLRYLAVAHFGRGRGAWVQADAPRRWTVEVEEALVTFKQDLRDALAATTKTRTTEQQAADLGKLIDAALRDALRGLYGSAAGLPKR